MDLRKKGYIYLIYIKSRDLTKKGSNVNNYVILRYLPGQFPLLTFYIFINDCDYTQSHAQCRLMWRSIVMTYLLRIAVEKILFRQEFLRYRTTHDRPML